jgi:uncharacterized protein YjbI with pentapeptide repeats
MGCSAGYDWCKNYPIVYKNQEEEYCIFHAPNGYKKVSLEKFNELVFNEIEKAEKENKKCDLSGIIFEGDISFKDKKIKIPISLSYAIFNGKVNFSRAIFNENVNFYRVRFKDSPLFIGTEFNKEVIFTWSIFETDAYFLGVMFNGKVEFLRSKILNGVVNFSQSIFKENVNFSGAEFKVAYFIETMFDKEVNFRNLSVEDALIFKSVNLKNADFLGTDLRICEFNACK